MGHRIRFRVVGAMILVMGTAYGIFSIALLHIGGMVGTAGFLGGGYLFIHAARYDGKRAAVFAVAAVAVMAALLPLVPLFPPPD